MAGFMCIELKNALIKFSKMFFKINTEKIDLGNIQRVFLEVMKSILQHLTIAI